MASQNALAAGAVAAPIDPLHFAVSAAADGPPQLAAVEDSAADVHAALLRVYTREQLKEICKTADVPVGGVQLSLAERLVSDVTAQNLCNIIFHLQASSSGMFFRRHQFFLRTTSCMFYPPEPSWQAAWARHPRNHRSTSKSTPGWCTCSARRACKKPCRHTKSTDRAPSWKRPRPTRGSPTSESCTKTTTTRPALSATRRCRF